MNKKSIALSLITALGLLGCGGSSGGSEPQPPVEEQPTPQPQPEPIEDIFCSVSYPLTIAQISQEVDGTVINSLSDQIKTNDSSWLAPSIDSNIIVELEEPALLRQMIITWQSTEYAHNFTLYSSKDKETWQLLDSVTTSQTNTIIPDVIALSDDEDDAFTGLYLKLELSGNQVSEPSELIEIEAYGCAQDVAQTTELIDWYLSVPTDTDSNGKSDSIMEEDLANGYYDPRFFTQTHDGGLQFTTSVTGYRTSTNTKYVRSELREMLRKGNTSHKTQGVNKNNWVFSSAPQTDLDNAGGVDGHMDVEVAVNAVTTTGEDYQIGRVIIGQIHANDDEPVRLYYRKLPNNTNGAIYIAHEYLDGDDIYFELIGSRSNDAENPVNGIPLNEKFSYSIDVVGNGLTVTVTKADGTHFEQFVDMSDSGYDQGGQYMYFKAGVYNQNNSGDQHDYVSATFYKIENTHN